MGNNEFRVDEEIVNLDGSNIKITNIEPSGYNYSLVKSCVFSSLVAELESLKQLLEEHKIPVRGSRSVVKKQLDSLQSAIEERDSDLETLRYQLSVAQNRIRELEKTKDDNVAFNNSFLNRMYFIGYLNCYYTRGQLLEKMRLSQDLNLEDFRDLLDELIKIKNKEV